MENIPVIKLGLVAVSRDCFPIILSEKRRAAIAEKCGHLCKELTRMAQQQLYVPLPR